MEAIRNKIYKNYKELLKLLEDRQLLISQLRPFKNGNGYDKSREIFLFSTLSKGRNLVIEEIVALSLIIEGQAAHIYNYPAWSKQIHLQVKGDDLIYICNPTILYFFASDSYRQIAPLLKDDYVVKDKVIAIDGPSGVGKSTIAKKLALKLGITYVDTGAIFRALGYFASINNISDDALANWLKTINIKYGEGENLISINGENVTKYIRDSKVAELASVISKKQNVRDFVLQVEHELSKNGVIVMEGRDIGSVVFPNAFCKIFLDASLEIRARRRFLELGGDFEQVKNDLLIRDERDSKRSNAPLICPEDAVKIETSDLNLEEVEKCILNIIRDKDKINGFGLCKNL